MGAAKNFRSGGGSGEIFAVRTRTFIDRPAVTDAVDRKTLRVAGRLGGYVRTVMRNSFRKKKGPSKPGTPPNRHIGTIRDLTEFGYELRDKTLVIGPHKISSDTTPAGGKTVPQLLNEGGRAMIGSYGGTRVPAYFQPRPFVAPALEKGVTKLRDLLREIPLEARGR